MFLRMALIAIVLLFSTQLAARTYTVTPQLYRVAYIDQVEDVDEKDFISKLSELKVKSPDFSADFGPLVASAIKRIEEYFAVSRADFTCDLNALMYGRCAADRIVIYSMEVDEEEEEGKEASSYFGASLVPLEQWDITKPYGVLPIRAGYRCELARLQFKGKWRLDPPKLRCKAASFNKWSVEVVEVVVEPLTTLSQAEQEGFVQLRNALYEALEHAGDKRFVSYRSEEAENAMIPIEAQVPRATRVDFVLKLIVQ